MIKMVLKMHTMEKNPSFMAILRYILKKTYTELSYKSIITEVSNFKEYELSTMFVEPHMDISP